MMMPVPRSSAAIARLKLTTQALMAAQITIYGSGWRAAVEATAP